MIPFNASTILTIGLMGLVGAIVLYGFAYLFAAYAAPGAVPSLRVVGGTAA